jgi:hypothetical protein
MISRSSNANPNKDQGIQDPAMPVAKTSLGSDLKVFHF